MGNENLSNNIRRLRFDNDEMTQQQSADKFSIDSGSVRQVR